MCDVCRACYRNLMAESNPLLNWKRASLPLRTPMHGRSVTLEPLQSDHHSAALWQALQGLDASWTWLSDGPYATEAAFRQSVAEKQASDNQIFYAVVPTATGQATGYASYLRIEPAHGVIEVGNILFSPRLQRTTAATEAMFLMARHVFEDLGYRRYEWKCNALNGPSRRAAQRLGFTFEGIFRQHMVIKGRNRDTAWFAMMDQEWPTRKLAFEAWLHPGNFDSAGLQINSLAHFMAL